MEVARIVPGVDFIFMVQVGLERMVPYKIPEEPMFGPCVSGFKNGRSICKDSGRWGVQSMRMEYEQGRSPLAAK